MRHSNRQLTRPSSFSVAWVFALVLLMNGMSQQAYAIDDAVFEEGIQRFGVLEHIDPGNQSVMINSLVYRVALDAQVEIQGRRSAFTLLTPGQNLRYAYKDRSEYADRPELRREIFVIQTVPSIPMSELH